MRNKQKVFLINKNDDQYIIDHIYYLLEETSNKYIAIEESDLKYWRDERRTFFKSDWDIIKADDFYLENSISFKNRDVKDKPTSILKIIDNIHNIKNGDRSFVGETFEIIAENEYFIQIRSNNDSGWYPILDKTNWRYNIIKDLDVEIEDYFENYIDTLENNELGAK